VLRKKTIAQQENVLSVLPGRNPGPIPRGKAVDEFVLPAVPAGLPSDLHLTGRTTDSKISTHGYEVIHANQ